jgi:hypothetical protein
MRSSLNGFRIYGMQYVINDGFTQKSTISVSCPSPVGSNGSSKSFLHASGDFVDLVLWNGVPFNDERIFQFLQRVDWMMTYRIRLFSMSETCSIEARSGERLGPPFQSTRSTKSPEACKKDLELPLLLTGLGQDTDIVDFCVNPSFITYCIP